MSPHSVFAEMERAMAVVAILVLRLGGKVEIGQADFDAITYTRIEEEGFGDGRLELRLVAPRNVVPS